MTHSPECVSLTLEAGDWRGDAGPADPDSFVLEASFFWLNEAIARLDELPIRGMREPIAIYLRGQAERGSVWLYAKGLEEDADRLAASGSAMTKLLANTRQGPRTATGAILLSSQGVNGP